MKIEYTIAILATMVVLFYVSEFGQRLMLHAVAHFLP